MKKILTLAMVVDSGQVLLGMKKRGFGVGRWNGFGGKVEINEKVTEAAKRELIEEVGLMATDWQEVGVLNFSFANNDLELEVFVYKVTNFEGQPIETDEMKPEWFYFADVPYSQMWPDDIYWLPLLLEGKKFRGIFHFDRPSDDLHTSVILKSYIQEVS